MQLMFTVHHAYSQANYQGPHISSPWYYLYRIVFIPCSSIHLSTYSAPSMPSGIVMTQSQACICLALRDPSIFILIHCFSWVEFSCEWWNNTDARTKSNKCILIICNCMLLNSLTIRSLKPYAEPHWRYLNLAECYLCSEYLLGPKSRIFQSSREELHFTQILFEFYNHIYI